MTSKNVLNLDTLVPDEKKVILGGKEFAVKNASMGLSIKMLKLQRKYKGTKKEDSDDPEKLLPFMEGMAAMLSDLFVDDSVTPEWLMDNVGGDRLNLLITFVSGGDIDESGAVKNSDTTKRSGSTRKSAASAKPAKRA